MYQVTENFKSFIDEYGREIKARVMFDDVVLEESEIFKIEKIFEGSPFRTISQQLNGEIKGRYDLSDKVIEVMFGVKYGDAEYEWINFGKFIVKEHERIVAENSDDDKTKFVAYDLLLKSHKFYDVNKLEITYPISLQSLLEEICNTLQIDYGGESFNNGEMLIEEDKWTNIEGITYRNIFDEIASASGTTIMIIDDKLVTHEINTDLTEAERIKLPKIYEDNMKSLKLQELYGPVNILNLAREGAKNEQGDNEGSHNNYVYPENWEDIPINSRNELVIADNQIIDKRREEYAEGIYNNIENLAYYPFESKLSGVVYLGPMDVVDVIDMNGTSHISVVTKGKLTITSGIAEELSSKKPIYAKEQYALLTDNKKRFMKVYHLVDQQNGIIEGVVQNVDEVNSKIEENTSITNQTASAIQNEVIARQELENEYRETSTLFKQTKDDFEFQFKNIVDQLTSLDDVSKEQFVEIYKYIRFIDGNIILGEIGNELVLNIGNDRISFLQDNSEVAYFSDKKLYVTDGEFINSLTLGKFAFYPQKNGNLSFRKVVD